MSDVKENTTIKKRKNKSFRKKKLLFGILALDESFQSQNKLAEALGVSSQFISQELTSLDLKKEESKLIIHLSDYLTIDNDTIWNLINNKDYNDIKLLIRLIDLINNELYERISQINGIEQTSFAADILKYIHSKEL